MIIEMISMTIILCFVSLIAHEEGHRQSLKRMGYDASVERDKKGFFVRIPEELTTKQKKLVLLDGILFGLVPLALLMIFYPIMGLMMLPYLAGCRKDIAYLFKKQL